MTGNLLLVAAVIIACVICNKISHKIGMPMLLAFILLGMLFGSDGILKIPFSNFHIAEQICSLALIFIMFYGGFGTRWSAAKPIIPQAILLSSLGTLMTAGLVGLFCRYLLKISFLESLLIGAVISSTDAASVFSILRSKHLNFKYNTASLLEIESGSNDPFSYMLTIIVLSLMNGQASVSQFAFMLFAQIFFGLVFGFGIAGLSLLFLKRFKISSSGFSAIFMVAIAIISYASPALLGGNGYLAAYIAGFILGNNQLDNKQELVHFFDGMTGLMQMLLFFLLGLLSFPSQFPAVTLTALWVALFLTFIARPIAVFVILTPFKSNIRQQLLVAWAGMRGAASIVFAIMAVINPASTNNDIFHMIFFIVLFSVLLQGTLLPVVARILAMTDPDADVMKTFNDYTDENPVQFMQFTIPSSHPWAGKEVCEILLPPDTLLVLLLRGDTKIIPTGKTMLSEDDILILGGLSIGHTGETLIDKGYFFEKRIELDHAWAGKPISDIHLKHDLVVLIKRGKKVIIPNGDIVLLADDILVIADKINLG